MKMRKNEPNEKVEIVHAAARTTDGCTNETDSKIKRVESAAVGKMDVSLPHLTFAKHQNPTYMNCMQT